MDSLRSLDLHSSAFCKTANSLHTFYIFLKKSISKVKQILNYNCISERYFEASFKTNRISTVSLSVNVLLLLFSRPVMSDSLRPHGLQHARPPCPHNLPEFAQVHVHCLDDAIQPSHPLMPSTPALSLSQHQGLFQWAVCSYQMTQILKLQLQHQSFKWVFTLDFP